VRHRTSLATSLEFAPATRSGGNRLVDQPATATTPVTPMEERKGGANAK
jgi:hypothetical protein